MSRLLMLVLLLFAAQASAQLYRWVDEKGRTQYGGKPPPGAKARLVEGTTPQQAAPPASPASTAPTKQQPYKRVFTHPGDPAAEKREAKAREQKRIAEAKGRDARAPACEEAREELKQAERSKLAHPKKKGAKEEVLFTNEEQIEEIHKRRRKVNQICY